MSQFLGVLVNVDGELSEEAYPHVIWAEHEVVMIAIRGFKSVHQAILSSIDFLLGR